MNTKQVFLYKSTSILNKEDLDALRSAGFVPVGVESFDDVRVIDPYAVDTRADVWSAAMEAIAKANSIEGVKTLFGRLLSEKLSHHDVAIQPKSKL